VNAWSSTRPARLAVAIATGAVAAVLLGLAVWAQSARDDAAAVTNRVAGAAEHERDPVESATATP
jgi:hypothetical protein